MAWILVSQLSGVIFAEFEQSSLPKSVHVADKNAFATTDEVANLVRLRQQPVVLRHQRRSLARRRVVVQICF